MKTGHVLFGIPAVILAIIFSVYAYSMPYEQWLGLFQILKICAWTFVIIVVLRFFTGAFMRVTQKDDWRWEEINNSAPKIENDFIPLEFAKWEKIDNHTQQVSWKDKSFLVWKSSNGKNTLVQEINSRGTSVGSPLKGSAKEAATYMKKRFKDI